MSVYVVGAGGHAKVVIATLQAAGHRVEGIWDDDPAKRGTMLMGVPVLGPVASLRDGMDAVIAIGDNRLRHAVAVGHSGVRWARAVHPAAHVHASVQLGEGTVVFAGAVVQPDTVIGAHSIVNTGATVDHDCILADYVHVAPGVHLSGGVGVGEGTLLGVGSCAVPGVAVGRWVTVGAGATVIRDLPDGVTAVGVPATYRAQR